MAVFTVLEPLNGKDDDVVFVKEGFAFWALVFTVFWALWHRMWVVAAILFALFLVSNLAVSLGGVDAMLAGWAGFAISLLFGFEARKLRGLTLERAGYRNAGLIEASGPQAAELEYFAQRNPAPDQQARTPSRPYTDDMLNLFGNM